MFECTEIAEQVYKWGTSSKITTSADANFSSHDRKSNGGESTSTTIPKKIHSGKIKRIMQAIRSIDRPVTKHVCCMAPETPQISVMYSSNTMRITLRSGPKKNKEAYPGSKNKRGKLVKFNGKTQEVNIVASHVAPTPKKKKQNQPKSVRVNKILQIYYRMDALLALTT